MPISKRVLSAAALIDLLFKDSIPADDLISHASIDAVSAHVALSTLRRHGLDFGDAKGVFERLDLDVRPVDFELAARLTELEARHDLATLATEDRFALALCGHLSIGLVAVEPALRNAADILGLAVDDVTG